MSDNERMFEKQRSEEDNLLTESDRGYTDEQMKGVGGTPIYGGYVSTNEKNPKLSGRQKYITFSDTLANTTIVGAGVRYFLNLVAFAKWELEPANDSQEAKDLADFVTDVITDMETPWERVVRRSAMYKFYGFSVQEWAAKVREDGRIGLDDIASRPQHSIERWHRVRGKIVGILQRSPQSGCEIYLPMEKVIYLVEDSLTDSPEGIGIFRHIVEVADRLRRYEQLEGFGFETDLRGIPVGRAPLIEIAAMVKRGEITQEQADGIKKPIVDFLTNHIRNPKLGMLVDSSVYRSEGTDATPSSNKMWELDLLRGGSNSQEEIATAINRLNHEIARLIGVEHLFLGSDGRGTQALSRDKSHNFYLIIDSALSELASAFRKQLIERLWQLNGLDRSLMPSFKTEAVQYRDVEQISTVLKDIANAGAPMAPDDPAINELYQNLGIPPRDLSRVMEDLTFMGNMARSMNGNNQDSSDTQQGSETNEDESEER